MFPFARDRPGGLLDGFRKIPPRPAIRLHSAAAPRTTPLRKTRLEHYWRNVARARSRGTQIALYENRSMNLTILSVAYPLTPVGPDAVGGSEQILTLLDAALTRAGHRSIVVACEGSKPTGT